MIPTNEKIIHLVVAARPNFMKIAPLYHALKEEDWAVPMIVHTGQHYDFNMSDAFFQDLGIPQPHLHLGVGSANHGEQTGKVIIEYEKVLLKEMPDMIVVAGDVNSTMASALAATKIGIKVAHLEAGLRSFDRTMPEEINRVVTDALADLLWTHSPDADVNLLREGIPAEKIERVGNIMIDSLEALRHSIESKRFYLKHSLEKGDYGLVTMHRPSNVDSASVLGELCKNLICISKKIPLIIIIHPRTLKNLNKYNLMHNLKQAKNLYLLDPLNYISFMNLVFNCRLVITDSGGLQEETTYLGIPCLTIRENTERPITVQHGTNRLCKPEEISNLVNSIISDSNTKRQIPEKWDGRTAHRVVRSIKRFLLETC